MKETDIETFLIRNVHRRGGFTRKVTYQGRKGAPDRWCFFPGGRLLLIELKRPGEKPSDLQVDEMLKLREHGQYVCWAASKEAVELALNEFEVYPADEFNEEWTL